MNKEEIIKLLKISRETELTPRKKIGRFAVSDSYPKLAKEILFFQNDYIKAYYMQVYLNLIEKEFEAFVRILSGKRDTILNKKVGGARHSAHLWLDETIAVDFFMLGIDMNKVYKYILKNLIFGECFYYSRNNFIHFTLPFKGNLNQSGLK